jgi:hypothetical protein
VTTLGGQQDGLARDQWETLLAARRADHDRLTRQIVALETELNDRHPRCARVPDRLFDLTPAEIRIIEETTKYPYGEV